MQRSKRNKIRIQFFAQLQDKKQKIVSTGEQMGQLRYRNYEIQDDDQDSIDFQDIVSNNKLTFYPQFMSHYQVSQNLELYANNYSTEQQSKEPHLIKPPQPTEPNHQVKIQEKINTKEITEELISYNKQIQNIITQNRIKIEDKNIRNDEIIEPRHLQISRYLNSNGELQQATIPEISSKYRLTKRQVICIYKQWQTTPKKILQQPTITEKYSDSNHEDRIAQRIKPISELLQQNPYLTQKQIFDKLAQKNNKMLISTIIRLMRMTGYKRIPVIHELSNRKQKIIKQNLKQFLSRYNQLTQNKNTKFYFFAECLFHKDIYRDSYWSRQNKRKKINYSQSFISQGIIMIAFLTPTGNLLWEAREGNYKREDYLKVITKMMKKYCKPHDVVIVNETPLRDLTLSQEAASKIKCDILKFTCSQQLRSPLYHFYEKLKVKMKETYEKYPDDALSYICEHVQSIQKKQLLNLLQGWRKKIVQVKIA